ncbi:putative ATPase [Nocardia pseudobrasiliensis]|uniref:Putative ATPase n=2 Tax=Nocardia pseudobrasiliensis TaxID=45979 RepID=A0A370HPV3_9NOCA|nr:putative ATPase [Nocardia pseudobrasiliensis]
MRATRAPGRGRGSLVQRISDWRAGRNVPYRFESFEPVLVTLLRMAEATAKPAPAGLSNHAAWHRLWKAAATAEPARPVVTTALRRDIATFVGRDAEVRRLLEAARPGGVVAIHTVDGMPGIGKTALVTRAAHLLADRFPDGRFFVELNAHTPGHTPADPFTVLGTLLTNLGIADGHLPESLEARCALWRDRLSDKRVLLVLDDARDHTQIEPLLPAGPGCLTLITSRRRLIALDGAQPLPLETLDPEHAAELFCRLAQRDPTGSEADAVADIVRSCGYLPLALVLLAGRLAHHPTWTLTGLATELGSTRDRLGELDTGHRAAHAAFTTSYRNLPTDRQRLFRRLGLHPGVDLDAYAVAALCDLPLTAARHALEDLYTDHLIDEISLGRYRLHDLLREFADNLARDDPTEDRARAMDRLLDYYQRAALTAVRLLPGYPESRSATSDPVIPDLSTSARAVTWVRRERANLMACLEYATANAMLGRVITLTDALIGELRLCGPWQKFLAFARHDAVTGLNQFRAGQLGLPDLGAADLPAESYSQAADLLQRLVDDEASGDDRHARAEALHTLAWARFLSDHHEAAIDALEQSVTMHRELGDRAGEAAALTILGWIEHVVGDDVTAVALLQRALTLHRDLGNRAGEAEALRHLGILRHIAGDHVAGMHVLRRVAQIYSELGDRYEQALATGMQAWIASFATDRATVVALHQHALAIYRDAEDLPGQAMTLNALGWIHHQAGNLPAAWELTRRALALYREIGDRTGEASVLHNMGRLRFLEHDYADATDLIGQACEVYRGSGNLAGEAVALGNLGWVRYLTGDRQAATDLLELALARSRAIGHRRGEIEALDRLDKIKNGTTP